MERKKASDFPQELLNLFDGYVSLEVPGSLVASYIAPFVITNKFL